MVQTETQTDRQTHTHTHTKTDRHQFLGVLRGKEAFFKKISEERKLVSGIAHLLTYI